MTEEYEYMLEEEFVKLLNKLSFKIGEYFKQDRFKYVYEYEDSLIYIRTKPADYEVISANNWLGSVYRVDRKRFPDSSNELLREYPNIVYALGKYPDYDTLVKYSKEVGYIIPHIKRLVNDDEYLKAEQVMFLLEN